MRMIVSACGRPMTMAPVWPLPERKPVSQRAAGASAIVARRRSAIPSCSKRCSSCAVTACVSVAWAHALPVSRATERTTQAGSLMGMKIEMCDLGFECAI